ncbi:putative membrane protein YczE [Conyzicola lurida]|uniref:Putative membrane protein YczE n=1 Tax=Conyzicola lurida TaxID=1172621 RepID=A0A841AS49_9MICO|nr:hypothetical protein [Conyzicola lurida]MBB5845094.1 putative membrane protein YczE [Conyzicola lurida]
MNTSALLARRILQLLVGLFFYGFALSMMIRGAVGVPPWEVLSQGVAKQTGLPFGLLVNIIGALVLLLWIPIRQKPGIGTVANVLLLGPAAEFGLAVLPVAANVFEQVLLFAGGLALLAIASGLYIGARFGPGPRDGLMTGIHNRWGFKIWKVRTAIEVTVLTVGWLLGGNVGLGTLAFALFIGPMVGVTLPWLRVPTPAATRVEPVETPVAELVEAPDTPKPALS